MVEKRSETHYSPEVFTYQFETEVPEALRTIFDYRHKLMEKFVEHISTSVTVESTRIIHQVAHRGERITPVVFEFTVVQLPEDVTSTWVVTTGNLDYIVDKLFKALDAESSLFAAQRALEQNPF